MSSIYTKALLDSGETGSTVIILEPFKPAISLFRDRKNDSFIHKCGDAFNFIIQTIVFYIMSLVPLCDMIIDIGTAILYFNSTEYRTVYQILSFVCSVLIFLSARSYLVSFIACSEKYSLKFFPDPNLAIRMSYCIPFIGYCIAYHCFEGNPSATRSSTLHGVWRWFCIEFFMTVGNLFVPFFVLYVTLQNYYFISLQLYMGLKSIVSNPQEQNTIHEIYTSLKTQHKMYRQQNTLLKFCQIVFESIPQLILQSCVFLLFDNVYDNFETQLMYVSSVCIKFLAIFRTGYIIFENWDNLQNIFE